LNEYEKLLNNYNMNNNYDVIMMIIKYHLDNNIYK